MFKAGTNEVYSFNHIYKFYDHRETAARAALRAVREYDRVMAIEIYRPIVERNADLSDMYYDMCHKHT